MDMELTKLIVNIAASFGLLVFGGWILYSGVKMILQKYDWKPAPVPDPGTKGLPGQGQRRQMNNVDQLLFSVNKMIDPSMITPLRVTRKRDEGGENSVPGPGDEQAAGDSADPANQPSEDTSGEVGAAGAETTKQTLFDGVAKIIEALPDLLKADFGPIVVICIAGLVVMGAGFYIIVMVINAAG
jgi:hypothetical protein